MLTQRAASTADIPAILELADACETFDQLNRPLHTEDLPSPLWVEEPARDWQVWDDAVGHVVAFARLHLMHTAEVPTLGRFWLYVHPEARGQNVEAAMIYWVDAQTHTAAQEQGHPDAYRLMTAAREDKHERRTVLAQHGFHPVRYFFTMHRSFDAPVAEPLIPRGFTIRSVDAAHDLPAYVALGNAAFTEHWGHQDDTEDDLRRLMQSPGYRPDLDLLAVTPSGELAGFCTCTLDEWFVQYQSGLVLGLGTHPRYRGIGLGRGLLLSGLHQLKLLGLRGAEISVDGENPTGAVKLYESVGFVPYETWITYLRS